MLTALAHIIVRHRWAVIGTWVAQHPPQRALRAPPAGGLHVLRRGDVPRAGHAELAGDRAEVVERRLDDGPGDGAHRRRPAREVAGRPVGLQVVAEGRVLLLRLGREVDHRVQRLERRPGGARRGGADGARGAHRASSRRSTSSGVV